MLFQYLKSLTTKIINAVIILFNFTAIIRQIEQRTLFNRTISDKLKLWKKVIN